MGRIYAGILGPLAMTVVICRGIKESGGVEGTLTLATLSLVVFAIVGFALGHLAQTTVEQSVRQTIETELAHRAAAPGRNQEAVS